MADTWSAVPTCWGTQLNGNSNILVQSDKEISPYLLGNTVEWKRIKNNSLHFGYILVPTCWGTQLNGNPARPQLTLNWRILMSLLVGEHS